MHVFIDTNILVRFYELPKDSLVELEKLVVLIKQGKATLWLPDQVEKEFWKNREPSIAKYLSEFAKGGAMGAPPLLAKEHAEFENLKKLNAAIEKKRAEIVADIRAQVAKEKTRADQLVKQLFDLAKKIDTQGPIFATAQERAARHLPPGKQDGVGDRICWIALLQSVPSKENLFVISDDGDYASEGDENEMSSYLRHEWSTKKQSEVTLWRRASKFLAKHVPDAQNAIEVERTLLVERLEQSGSFNDTHLVIAEFTDLSHLNQALIDRLALALASNSQIYFISDDQDVKKFVQVFIAQYGAKVDEAVKAKIAKHYQ